MLVCRPKARGRSKTRRAAKAGNQQGRAFGHEGARRSADQGHGAVLPLPRVVVSWSSGVVRGLHGRSHSQPHTKRRGEEDEEEGSGDVRGLDFRPEGKGSQTVLLCSSEMARPCRRGTAPSRRSRGRSGAGATWLQTPDSGLAVHVGSSSAEDRRRAPSPPPPAAENAGLGRRQIRRGSSRSDL